MHSSWHRTAPRKWTWLDYFLAWNPVTRIMFGLENHRPDDGDPSVRRPTKTMAERKAHAEKLVAEYKANNLLERSK